MPVAPTIMSEHFIEKCSCGKILNQCRCMSKHKTVIFKHDACDECQGKVKKAVAKMSRLELEEPSDKKFNKMAPWVDGE